MFDVRAQLTVGEVECQIDKIINLSVGGCLLFIDKKLPLGVDCTFTLALDGVVEGVELYGEIVRSDGQEVSIKFTKVDPGSLFHLQNIIRYNSEDPDTVEKEISEHPGLR